MHPAPSVILFTTLSGVGFGLLAFLGLGMPAVEGFSAFAFYTIAFLLAAGGLIASTFHLGHPERALLAFTQWRTSWLSREAWISTAALVVNGLFAAGIIFAGQRWQILGWLGAALALLTVLSTSMIYAQLKTVPRWHTPLTPVLFLSLAVAGGALLSGQTLTMLVFMALAGVVQVGWWIAGDQALGKSGTSVATATGLGPRTRSFAPPHTGTNYLLDEMVFKVGRKHALRLRGFALLLGYVVPMALLILPFMHALAVMAVASHLVGIAISRWLFFAEAEHVVGLYYGQR